MKRNHSFLSIFLLTLLAMAGCQKFDHPAMPDYKKDPDNPGGVLKFYTAFEGVDLDSIKATFGTATNATYENGITGKAYKGSTTSYIKYPSSNDFSKATSFTISFWMKSSPHAADRGAEMVFGLSTTKENIDHRSDIFLLIENVNQSTPALGAFKFYLLDQWFEFTGAKRIPNALNNQWHHFAFTYDETSSKLVTYVDGALLTGLPDGFGDVKNAGNPRGKLDLTKSAGLIIGGPAALAVGVKPPDWMVNYTGALDQFRLYNKVLSAAEITALFNAKQ